MQSYSCATASSYLLPIKSYYTIEPNVVGVIADLTTVTPSGATSIATVEVRTFASASPPHPTSVLMAASKTSTIASPSSTHSSIAHASTPIIVPISLSVLVAILALAFGLWQFWRRRNSSGYGCGIRSSRFWTRPRPSVAPSESVSRVNLLGSAKNDLYRTLAREEAALQTFEGRSASIPRGLKGDASPKQGLSSEISQATQPSFF